jgi:hypothetical protein
MEQWRAQGREFIVETHYLKNGDSVVKTQRIFLITETFLSAIPCSYGQETSERVLPYLK